MDLTSSTFSICSVTVNFKVRAILAPWISIRGVFLIGFHTQLMEADPIGFIVEESFGIPFLRKHCCRNWATFGNRTDLLIENRES